MFSGVGVTVVVLLGTLFVRNHNKKNEDLNKKNEEANVFCTVKSHYKPIISLYSIVPSAILRWRFKESRINSLINIDVRPRGDAIRLNLGELPDCQVWVQFVNHSPFDLDVESIKGELVYRGCKVSVETRDHIDISKHSSKDSILLEGVMTGEQAIHCSHEDKSNYSSLILRGRIRTKFGLFKKYTGDLQSLHIEIINARKIIT